MSERLSERDALQWQRWGRGLLFILGVASLLMAAVTFIAHNWVYLSTVGKLVFVGVWLVAAAIAWIATRFDSAVSQSFGIAAQILIGIWLAAAGQLYQARGGAQDLFLTWAMLGLPFAFASRSHAHWLLWIAVAALAIVMPYGTRLSILGDLDARYRFGFLALFSGAAYMLAARFKSPDWFTASLAALAAAATAITGILGIFEFETDGLEAAFFIPALLVAVGLFLFARRDGRLAPQALFMTSGVAMIAAFANRVVFESAGFGLGTFVLLTLVNGGATYLLVKLFESLRPDRTRRARTDDDQSPNPADEDRPWYMDMLVAIGGIVTAILTIATLVAFLTLTIGMDFETIGIPLTVIGLMTYGIGLWLRLRTSGTFLRYFLSTFVLAGVIAVWAGIGLETESFRLSAILPLGLSALALYLIPERVSEILFAILIATAVTALVAETLPFPLIFGGPAYQVWHEPTVLLALGGLAVAAFAMTFRGRTLFAAGAVWLLIATLFATSQGNALGETSSLLDNWPLQLYAVTARLAVLALLLFGVSRASLGRNLPSLPVLIPLTLLAALMPPGGASAFLLLLFGYLIGSRTLALIGVIVTALFYFWAYFDLSLTLMELSALLAFGGGIMLAIWRLAGRRLQEVSP